MLDGVFGDRQHMAIDGPLLRSSHVKAIGALTATRRRPIMRSILRSMFGALALAALVTISATALTPSSAAAKGMHGGHVSHGHHGMRHSFRHMRLHRYSYRHYRHWHSHYRWRWSRYHYHYRHHHYRHWRWYGHYRYCNWYRGDYCWRYRPYYRSYGYRSYSEPSYSEPSYSYRSDPAPKQTETCLIKQYLPNGAVLFKNVACQFVSGSV